MSPTTSLSRREKGRRSCRKPIRPTNERILPMRGLTSGHQTIMIGYVDVNRFHVVFSADFRDENGCLLLPDIGLSLLNGIPDVSYEFLGQYHPEYPPEQLQ